MRLVGRPLDNDLLLPRREDLEREYRRRPDLERERERERFKDFERFTDRERERSNLFSGALLTHLRGLDIVLLFVKICPKG